MAEYVIGGTLQHLIEACRNSEVGYRAAAEHLQDESLKQVFHEYARQRCNFYEALQQKVHAASMTQPIPQSSTVRNAQKTWLKLKSAIKRGDPNQIIQVVEAAEKALIQVYRETLCDPNLHLVSRMTVQAQYSSVYAAHQHVQSLLMQVSARR